VTTPDAEQRLELHHLRHRLGCEIIYLTPKQSGPAGLFDLSLINQLASKVESYPEAPPARLHGLNDCSLILHTSGTSGKKKVVPYTLRSLIIGTLAVVKSWNLRPDDVNSKYLACECTGRADRWSSEHDAAVPRWWHRPQPLGSSFLRRQHHHVLWFRCFILLDSRATFGGDLVRLLMANPPIQCAHLPPHFRYYAAPTMHHAILASRPEAVDASRDTRIRLICNAAGGLLPTLAQELRDVFGGCTVLPSYGMTECMPIASPPPSYQLERPGCSGIACGPYLSIRDPANIDEELPTGKTGAICVRGFPTFEGYEVSENGPLDTSAFSKDGWFDSGDCGWMDADGYLYITGRSKEIINKGGEVISPFEIEEAVMSVARDKIKATLAFSIEHDVLQEHIGLLVVPALGQPPIGLTELHDRLREHLHPSKWPFVIVYMDDLPKNATGKPLRIGLAPRLKLGSFTDSIPVFHCHFQAKCPPVGAPPSQPITCAVLIVDELEAVRGMKTIAGIQDVALRVNAKNVEAFVSISNDTLDSQRIARALLDILPGYVIPGVIHVWDQPLLLLPSGMVDFDGMEREMQSRQVSVMTHEEAVVRDIIAQLLSLDPKFISADSDFFLLGGNSLLVGRLAHAIRKATRLDVQISALFTNSTVRGIASMLIDGNPSSSKVSLTASTLIGTTTPDSASTVYCSEAQQRTRGWTHPLSLIVQVIPFIFFYPLKIAWKCTC
jgi:acyl-CoA synthetase (AMP-forming)/AMP-acid ligase II